MKCEQYRGFTIEFRLAMFSIEAVAKNGRGGFIASVYGNDQDDARQKLHNKIDNMLKGEVSP
ncbi:MAG: hypothetical protein KC441_17385 [Anaerolineales bacterium]|nr:hypothetical protein [Anaerolineales bacterium]